MSGKTVINFYFSFPFSIVQCHDWFHITNCKNALYGKTITAIPSVRQNFLLNRSGILTTHKKKQVHGKTEDLFDLKKKIMTESPDVP